MNSSAVLMVSPSQAEARTPEAVRALRTSLMLRHALGAVCTGAPNAVHEAVARDSIAEADRLEPDAIDSQAVAVLATELARSMRGFDLAAWPSVYSLNDGGRIGAVRDGMLWLDAVGADHLEGTGEAGQREAAAMREGSRRRMDRLLARQPALIPATNDATIIADPLEVTPTVTADGYLWWHWYNPTYAPTRVRFARLLALCLWVDRVKAAVAEAKHPTYPLRFIEAVARACFAPDREAERRGDQVVIRAANGAEVARTNPAVAAIPSVLLRDGGLATTVSLTAQRVFRDLPYRARLQALRDRLDLDRASPRLRIDGGLRRYCRMLGIGEGHTRELRDVLDVFQTLNAIDTDGTAFHGLLLWEEEEPASRRSQRRIVITPSKALLTGGGRGKLIPVPHRLPRFSGSPNERAGQAVLQLLVIVALRAGAMELAEGGGVTLTDADWRRMADQANVSRTRLEELLSSTWVEDAHDGPAFLRRVGPATWTLGPAYSRELEVLRQGGAYDLAGRRGGEASAQRRAAIAGRIAESGEKPQ